MEDHSHEKMSKQSYGDSSATDVLFCCEAAAKNMNFLHYVSVAVVNVGLPFSLSRKHLATKNPCLIPMLLTRKVNITMSP